MFEGWPEGTQPCDVKDGGISGWMCPGQPSDACVLCHTACLPEGQIDMLGAPAHCKRRAGPPPFSCILGGPRELAVALPALQTETLRPRATVRPVSGGCRSEPGAAWAPLRLPSEEAGTGRAARRSSP